MDPVANIYVDMPNVTRHFGVNINYLVRLKLSGEVQRMDDTSPFHGSYGRRRNFGGTRFCVLVVGIASDDWQQGQAAVRPAVRIKEIRFRMSRTHLFMDLSPATPAWRNTFPGGEHAILQSAR